MPTRKPKPIVIPGFKEAEASERRDRAVAFLGLPELICGVKCAPLTPHRLEYLRAIDSPFIVGGRQTDAAIRQFLWVVATEFTVDATPARMAFLASIAMVDLSNASRDIDDYLDRAFLDMPQGKAARPYFSFAAAMVFQMAEPPYHWPMEKTMHTPVAVCLQLMKARTQAMGGSVHNRRSQKAEGDWLDVVQRRLNREAKKKGGTNGHN